MAKVTDGLRRRGVLVAVGAAAGAGFPHIAGAQAKVIWIGMPTILSGPVAILGTSSRAAVQLAVKQFNEAGGVNGRMIELVDRDSKGRPDEAAKVTRDLINNDSCEIIIDAEASSGSFAVQEVIRDLPVLCVHTCSETSSLTADPKVHVKTAFRSARQGIHDAVAGGKYASAISRAKGLKRWMTCSPDYAYGRDNTAEFMEFAKRFDLGIEQGNLYRPDLTNRPSGTHKPIGKPLMQGFRMVPQSDEVYRTSNRPVFGSHNSLWRGDANRLISVIILKLHKHLLIVPEGRFVRSGPVARAGAIPVRFGYPPGGVRSADRRHEPGRHRGAAGGHIVCRHSRRHGAGNGRSPASAAEGPRGSAQRGAGAGAGAGYGCGLCWRALCGQAGGACSRGRGTQRPHPALWRAQGLERRGPGPVPGCAGGA